MANSRFKNKGYVSREQNLLIRYLIKNVRNTINNDVSVITKLEEDDSLKYTYNTKKALASLRSIVDKKSYYKDQKELLNNLRDYYMENLIKLYNGTK